MAYGLLATPGSQGADIVCGEGQSFGLSQAFGGPYLGLMATRKAFVRNLPGRLVGQTVDNKGKRAFVLGNEFLLEEMREAGVTAPTPGCAP